MTKSTPGRRRRAAVVILTVCLSPWMAGCASGASPAPIREKWTLVPDEALVPQAGSQPFPVTVLAGSGGGSSGSGSGSRSWLIAGVVITLQAPRTEGLVVSDQLRQVAIWQATSPSGPWTRAQTTAVPGRDGPNETIMYLAGNKSTRVAFGSRASPTEGYPRPSAWTESPAGWTEALEPRELFGGPNIVGFGGMAAGPHGFFVAGTWSDSHGHAGASVWSSADGGAWTRTADPSFDGLPGETPFGAGIADNDAGALLAATAEAPSPKDPGGQHGALWYSPTGRQWRRLPGPGAGNSTFGAVISVGRGWIVAGTIGAAEHRRAAIWMVNSKLGISNAQLLPGSPSQQLAMTTIAGADLPGNRERLLVGGVADGQAELWSATIGPGGKPASWRKETPPPNRPPDLERVTASMGQDQTMVALVGKTTSEIWHT